MDFEDNDILALLSGEHNHYLAHIEKSLEVSLDSFGNSIKITGPAKSTKTARRVIEDLYKKIHAGAATDFDKSMVDDALRWAMNGHPAQSIAGAATIDTWKKKIVAKTKGQQDYLGLLRSNEVVFGLGPAGTGKTYMAVARAVDTLHAGLENGPRALLSERRLPPQQAREGDVLLPHDRVARKDDGAVGVRVKEGRRVEGRGCTLLPSAVDPRPAEQPVRTLGLRAPAAPGALRKNERALEVAGVAVALEVGERWLRCHGGGPGDAVRGAHVLPPGAATRLAARRRPTKRLRSL